MLYQLMITLGNDRSQICPWSMFLLLLLFGRCRFQTAGEVGCAVPRFDPGLPSCPPAEQCQQGQTQRSLFKVPLRISILLHPLGVGCTNSCSQIVPGGWGAAARAGPWAQAALWRCHRAAPGSCRAHPAAPGKFTQPLKVTELSPCASAESE